MARSRPEVFWVFRVKTAHHVQNQHYELRGADRRVAYGLCAKDFERISGLKMSLIDPPRKVRITIEAI